MQADLTPAEFEEVVERREALRRGRAIANFILFKLLRMAGPTVFNEADMFEPNDGHLLITPLGKSDLRVEIVDRNEAQKAWASFAETAEFAGKSPELMWSSERVEVEPEPEPPTASQEGQETEGAAAAE